VGITMIQDLTSNPKSTMCVVLRFFTWVEAQREGTLPGESLPFPFSGRRRADALPPFPPPIYPARLMAPNNSMATIGTPAQLPSRCVRDKQPQTIIRRAQEQ
jgi:hypothetical protein